MSISQYIEHTNLSPTLTISDPPFWVKRVKREIGASPIALVTVAGFPLGHNMTETKLDEIKRAIENGADEIHVVLNVKCSKLVHDHNKLLKVIIETAYLSDIEIETTSKLCADAGANRLGTSSSISIIKS